MPLPMLSLRRQDDVAEKETAGPAKEAGRCQTRGPRYFAVIRKWPRRFCE